MACEMRELRADGARRTGVLKRLLARKSVRVFEFLGWDISQWRFESDGGVPGNLFGAGAFFEEEVGALVEVCGTGCFRRWTIKVGPALVASGQCLGRRLWINGRRHLPQGNQGNQGRQPCIKRDDRATYLWTTVE